MTPPAHRPTFSCLWRKVAPVLCLLLSLWPAWASAEENAAPTAQLAADAQVIADAVNQRRAEAGLAPLSLHPLLNLAAQNHADDMVNNGAFGHMGSDGSYVRQRVQRIGYSSGGWASENWVSATGPENAMNWWMNDWIHRVNILNPRWREFGVGARPTASGRIIYVTVFTAGQGVEGEAPAAPANLIQVSNGVGLNYTIQPGDTLIAVAARYGVDWTMIATENRLREETLLQIGQTIRIPGVQDVGGPSVQTVSYQPVTDQSARTAGDGVYMVRNGDTLLGIALQHNVTWQALANANGLAENDLLQIGQMLTIPGAAQSFHAPAAQPAVYKSTQTTITTSSSATQHTVAGGETLLSIALRYNMTWQTLAAANQLAEDDLLQIGQVLQIPGSSVPAQLADLPVIAPPEPTQSNQFHTVSAGETIVSIALKYGLDWQQLLTLNGLSEASVLQIGQQIRLR
jgi:LysM repeat protein